MNDENEEIIGSYYGDCMTPKIGGTGTYVVIPVCVDISKIPDKLAQWIRDCYGSPAAVTIQRRPPGYEPDLPTRGAPKKKAI